MVVDSQNVFKKSEGFGGGGEGDLNMSQPAQYNTWKPLKIKFTMMHHQCIGGNGGSELMLRVTCFNSLKLLVNQKIRIVLAWKEEEER